MNMPPGGICAKHRAARDFLMSKDNAHSDPVKRNAAVRPDLAAKEAAVVGTLMVEAPTELPPHCDKLLEHAPESFDDLRHGMIAQAIRELRRAGRPIAPLTVREQLERSNKQFGDGGSLFLDNLPAAAVSIDIAEYEAADLWASYRTRRLKSVYGEAAARMEADPTKADIILANVRHSLDALDKEYRNGRRLTIRAPDDILALPQDPHDNILGDRLLAKGQSLTLLGPGATGKSRMVLQLAAETIVGEPFIGLETHGAGSRWLIIQVENGNRRLQADLHALQKAFGERWCKINERLLIHTLETDRDGWLSLEAEENQRAIAEAIAGHAPDVVVFDPLNQFAIGDPNKDQDMAATCQTIARLCRKGNPQRAIVILHHTLTGRSGAAKSFGMERAGYGRNSKVLQAWTRGQINLAPISEDNNDLLAVLCGKCSNGREFPPFAVRLNHDTMLYEVAPDVDMDAWRADVEGSKSNVPLMTPSKVRDLCHVSGMEKAQLAKAIMEDCGCYRGSAYRYIVRAEKAKTITLRESDGRYFRK